MRPFNFNPANGVNWLKKENGISFHDRGIVYSPAAVEISDQIPQLSKNESISIELWFTPGSAGSSSFACIFGLYNEHLSEIFSFSQKKTSLNLSKYLKPKNRNLAHNWRWLKNVFLKGQRRFLTITSNKTGTTVYIDGKKARKYRNYSLMFSRGLSPVWRMLLGNNPSGTKPWTGKIHSLAIYNQALSPDQIVEHFEKWKGESVLSLLNEKEIIALYPMDEQNGQIIHNAVRNHYNLLIPARYKILKKSFLKPSANALKLHRSTLRDVGLNILGFVPLGFLFFLSLFNVHNQSSKTSSWRLIILAVVCAASISLLVEILQAYLPTRISSLSDLIFNTIGSGIGIVFALLFIRFQTRSRGTSFSESQ